MKCEICGKEFVGFMGLSVHIAKIHKITVKKYYDDYLIKDNNDRKCLICEEESKFINLRIGYDKCCLIHCLSENKVICQFKENDNKVCKKECKSRIELSRHITKIHKISLKKYYDDYLRKNTNEGKCLGINHSGKKCEKETSFSGLRYGYCKFCSTECSSNNKEIREKVLKIFLKKFGGPSPYSSKDIREKGKRTNDVKNIKDPNRPKKIEEKRLKTCKDKYGGSALLCSKKIVEKVKQIKIKNGTQIPDDQLSDLQIYFRAVAYFTSISLQKKFTKEELGKRKSAGTEGGLHGDHKFSIFEGFKQNIIPCIIGCQSNLELIPWEDNLKKNIKCSITKEELFELYDQEMNQLIVHHSKGKYT